jgi:transposase
VKLMQGTHQSVSLALSRFGGHHRPILEPHKALVRALLDAKADISLIEIQAELRQHCIIVGATSTISRWLRRASLTHKKRLRAAEQDCADVAREGRHWRVW